MTTFGALIGPTQQWIEVDRPDDLKLGKDRSVDGQRKRLIGLRVEAKSGDALLRHRKGHYVAERHEDDATVIGTIVEAYPYEAEHESNADLEKVSSGFDNSDIIVRLDQPLRVTGETYEFARVRLKHDAALLGKGKALIGRNTVWLRDFRQARLLPPANRHYKRLIEVDSPLDMGETTGLLQKPARADYAERLIGKRVCVQEPNAEYMQLDRSDVRLLYASRDGRKNQLIRTALPVCGGIVRAWEHTAAGSVRLLNVLVELEKHRLWHREDEDKLAITPLVMVEFQVRSKGGRLYGRFSEASNDQNEQYEVKFIRLREKEYHRPIEIDGIDGVLP